VLAWIAIALALLLGAVMFLPAVLGLERYVITGRSMTGTYDRGTVLFERAVPVADLRTGDVITYDPPAGGPSGLVTHRIHAIRTENGRRIFRTKGDFNAAPDPWEFSLSGPTQARAVLGVPYAGYLIGALSDRAARMLLIGLPALLIAFGVLRGLWRDAGAEAERRRRREAHET
jgi:signal peptidase